MIETAQFLYQQSPYFWYALAGVFFLLGLLYATVAWRSYKYQLRSAQREKSQLLRERNQAITDRQRQRRIRETNNTNGVATPSTPNMNLNPPRQGNEFTDKVTGFATPTNPVTAQTPPKPATPISSQIPEPAMNNGNASAAINGNCSANPANFADLFSSSYQSGPKKNGTQTH